MSKAVYDNSKEESSIGRNTDSDCELDWSYTVRCINEWTDDELLSYLCSKAFTTPPRDYKPSTPFVSIKTGDGLTTILPHRYRLPLLFVARYQWETTFYTLTLEDRQRWEAVRKEILHLSRLCHALFMKARAKAESGGMDKTWRCIMFERVLTRFYKGMPSNSPSNLRSFSSRFGPEEYERNVLKYDWKRWVMKGVFLPSPLPNMRLTEKEINDGITAAGLKRGLSKINNVWMLMGTKRDPIRRPIPFMQATDCNQAELTDRNDDEPVELPRITNPNPPPPPPPPPHDTPAKRGREIPEDDDNNSRSGKRVKMEEIIRSLSSQPCTLPDGSHPLGSGGVVEEHAMLPNFRVPRQSLLSHGWKRLSAIDASARYLQREEEQEIAEVEAEAEVVPVCGFDNSSVPTPASPKVTSTSTPLPPFPLDCPMDDIVQSNANPPTVSTVTPNNDPPENSLNIMPPPFTPALNEKTPVISLSTPTSVSSDNQPESTSTYSTTTISTTIPTPTATTAIGSRDPRNSGCVSKHTAKGIMLRIRPPESEPAHPSLSSPATEGGGEGITIDVFGSHVVNTSSKITHESMLPSPLRQRKVLQSHHRLGAGDASFSDGGRERDQDMKMEEKRKGMKNTMKGKMNVDKLKKPPGIRGPRPLSSSSFLSGASPNSTTNHNHNKNNEQGEMTTSIIPTTSAATPNTPLVQVSNLDIMHAKALGEGEKKVYDLEKNSSLGTQISLPSSLPGASPNSTTNNKNNNDEQGEMMTTITTIPTTSVVTPNTPLGISHDQVPNTHTKAPEFEISVGGLDPNRVSLANPSGPASSSSTSLSLPTSSGLLQSAITNSGGGVATAATTAIGADAIGSAAQQLTDRLLKNSGGIVARVVELVKEIQGGNLGSGCVVGDDGGSSGHRDSISQTKEKGKGNCGLDVEMVDVSESAAMPGYADAAVGVDALVTFKDAYVQTDEPAPIHRPNVASTSVAATPLPETDDRSKTKNPQPSAQQPKDHQFTNTTGLSTIVDNLVSAKMLSMMQTLVKNGNNTNKSKLVETTITESDSDILRQPSPSSSSLSISASHSMEVYDNLMANLLDELKTIKEEARCREQNEKEELLAMRQLHSAEVDALRRRLSYLESRNLSLGRWEGHGGGGGSGGSGWRGSSSSMRVDPLDQFMEDVNQPYHSSSFRQPSLFGERSQNHHHHLQKGGLGSCSSSTVNSEGELSISNRLTNNTTTITSTPYTPLSFKKANFSTEVPSSAGTTTFPTPPTGSGINNQHFGSHSKNDGGGGVGHLNGMDLDDDISSNPLPLPLPVKSQRKHHIMALARAHFS